MLLEILLLSVCWLVVRTFLLLSVCWLVVRIFYYCLCVGRWLGFCCCVGGALKMSGGDL